MRKIRFLRFPFSLHTLYGRVRPTCFEGKYHAGALDAEPMEFGEKPTVLQYAARTFLM